MYETMPTMPPSPQLPVQKPNSIRWLIVVMGAVLLGGIIFIAMRGLMPSVPSGVSPVTQNAMPVALPAGTLDNEIYGQVQTVLPGSSVVDIDQDIQSSDTDTLDQQLEALDREQTAL